MDNIKQNGTICVQDVHLPPVCFLLSDKMRCTHTTGGCRKVGKSYTLPLQDSKAGNLEVCAPFLLDKPESALFLRTE